MKKSKEIIYSEEIHGFVFNERTIFLNEDVLKDFLKNYTGEEEQKRELLQSYVIHEYYIKKFIKPHTSYGNCKIIR